MSEEFESNFTVTLGRSGRVVKRSGRAPDSGLSGFGSVSGSKRSVKDRLGTSVDDSLEDRHHHKNKRQRGEENQESLHGNSSNGTCLAKGDLRFKLMHKNVSRQFQNNDPPTDVDLRVKLSSKATLSPENGERIYSPRTTNGTRKSTLETRNIYNGVWQNMVERRTYDGERQGRRDLRDSAVKQNMRERRDTYSVERRSMREPRDSYSVERRNRREPRDSYNFERRSMKEPRNGYDVEGQSMREPRGTYSVERRSMQEPRDSYSIEGRNLQEPKDSYTVERRSMREPRDSYNVEVQRMRDPRDTYIAERRSMREPRDSFGVEGRSTRELRDTYSVGSPSTLERGGRYDHGKQRIQGPIPSRMGSDLSAMGHARTSYPSWPLDNLRRRSPDRILCSSMVGTSSLERDVEELQRRASIRTYDDGKSNVYRRNEVSSSHRAAGSPTLVKQPGSNAVCPMPAKPAPVSTQFPQASEVLPRVPNPSAQPTVDGFLQSLGLEKYAVCFKAEEVDLHALRQMSDVDLKELGIPMGPRKRIIQALLSRPGSKTVMAQRKT